MKNLHKSHVTNFNIERHSMLNFRSIVKKIEEGLGKT